MSTSARQRQSPGPRSRRSLALVAVVLVLLGQCLGAVHAADLVAHPDATVCEVCVGMAGGQAIQPGDAVWLVQAPTGHDSSSSRDDRAPARIRACAYYGRAPPRSRNDSL